MIARVTPLRVERSPRRRGTFGLDERRRPDPERTEAALRAFLRERVPDAWALPAMTEPEGRTLVLLMPGGHAAVLRIARDPAMPGPSGRAAMARCRALRIPGAVVSTLEEARAALRRLGIEPRPEPVRPSLKRSFNLRM